eukprot:TRINITY_DN4757_c0_g1_i1.p1 TRINITY_DN4757_c0_g1~~TRINITY_DN4757_c0_g1_i1.p1  ORF type:complete len:817 (+),score=170.99 TRINITY_DN4757_c0_g1_i1:14-2464(+)
MASSTASKAEEFKRKGNEAFSKGENPIAIALYSNAIELDRKNHVLYSNRAAAYAKLEDWDNSLKDAMRCLELEPTFAKAYHRAGTALLELGRYLEAVDVLRDGVKANPSEASLNQLYKKACEKSNSNLPANPESSLVTPFGKIVGAIIWNPVIPLRFEQENYAKCTTDKIGQDPDFESEYITIITTGDDRALEISHPKKGNLQWSEPNIQKAYETAIKAYGERKSEDRIKMAEEALRISPKCAEAYNVLAEDKSTNFQEALEYYKQGMVVGREAISPSIWDKAVKEARLYEQLELRGYERCMQGAANTLRKMGLHSESLQIYQDLCRLDKEHSREPTAVNFRYNMVDVLLHLKKYSDARSLLKERTNNAPGAFSSQSTAVLRSYSLVLLDFIETGKTEKIISHEAFNCNHHVVAYLCGVKPFPNRYDTHHIQGQSSLTNAVLYARQHKRHWDDTPDAIKHLKQIYKEFISNAALVETDSGQVDSLKVWIEESKIFGFPISEIRSTTDGRNPLHVASYNGSTSCVRYVLGLKVFDVNSTEKNGLTPLHMACYNGFLEIVDLLIQHGADLKLKSADGQTPIEKAANQGEWSCVQRILKQDSSLAKDPNVIATCFGSVHACITGKRKCQRCIDQALPHSKICSPTKTVQILIENGANASLKDKNGTTLLHTAVTAGMLDSAKLIASKASKEIFTTKDTHGMTPLHHAIVSGEKEIALALIPYSVEAFSVKSNDGQTPDQACLEKGWKDVAEKIRNPSGSKSSGTSDTSGKAPAKEEGCAVCGKRGGKLKKCSRCLARYYCSSACQQKDWPTHKAFCKAV